jgi:replicative DNA helicase
VSPVAARIPPHNLDAERAVLGCLLLEGRVGMDLVAGSALQPADFYKGGHRTIFEVMRKLYEADAAIDLLTVSDALIREGMLEAVGGPPALALLVEHASLAVHLGQYVEIVVERGKLREFIGAGTAAVKAAYDAQQGADELTGELASALDRISRRAVVEEYDPALPWRSVVGAWKRGTLKVGLPALDTLNGGVGRGEFLAVGGRTSQGKTSFAANRARAMALRGTRVEFLTLEERVESIVRRLAADAATVATHKLRDGRCSPAEFARAEAEIRKLQDLPLTVRGVEGLRSADERAVVGAVSLSRAEVVIVDHLQKVQVRRQGRDDLQTYAIRRLLDRLHTIALRDRKVIWMNCQLSRETDKRKGPPLLSDLADSSAVESVARQVWLLHWPHKHADKEPPEKYTVYVAKNSEGGTGKVELRWEPQYGRFEDPSEAPF